MADIENMTQAEWQVMRIIWTLNGATSKQVIDVLTKKTSWKQATIKTLIVRLQSKGYLEVDKKVRPYTYSPVIKEEDAIDQSVNHLFASLCCMRKGQAIENAIENSDISKSDINELITILTKKSKDAPEEVMCDCLGETNNG
ncbi:CopY/TcrY family copper transport repressor [Companilactobacillus metriopterae]|uniref:CopY/TcrY family copper transport repressor n=1 Tax=Companilactobacillus metriopterae TaxID=1909267 RepID=UPI00100ADF23|nr:CopY/TcrY family copper transport repressor [Companilactobacillus metriopterae]